MIAAGARHPVAWMTPTALWRAPALDPSEKAATVLQRPEILRFADDRFMEEVLDVLARDPRRLAEYRARPESWQYPGGRSEPLRVGPRLPGSLRRLNLPTTAGAKKTVERSQSRTDRLSAPPAELKLYQPAHQRYYLVAASLVCRIAGFPDRRVDRARAQRVTFVLRRLMGDEPTESSEELALVNGEAGRVWVRVGAGDDARRTMKGEEETDLFPLVFADALDHERRIFAGLVPVGRRDELLALPRGSGGASSGSTAAAPSTDQTARKLHFMARVSEPWRALLDQASRATEVIEIQSTASERSDELGRQRSALLTGSWFVLLELAEYLQRFVPGVWEAVTSNDDSSLTGQQKSLFDAIKAVKVKSDLKRALESEFKLDVVSSLREALHKIALPENVTLLQTATSPFDADHTTGWPEFVFPMADPALEVPLPGGSWWTPGNDTADSDKVLQAFNGLVKLIYAAFDPDSTEPVADPPAVAEQPVSPSTRAWFVIRCIYHRPGCEPWELEEISPPSRPFQMAAFFDPDAPARPVRIGLPVDTTPDGLRRFDKNTVLVMSDVLCGQIKKFRSMTLGSLVLKPLDAGGLEPCKNDKGETIGMACSLSIPIVTLCALILLMVMVNLLEIVFRWLPYFILCFPIPGLRAKRSA